MTPTSEESSWTLSNEREFMEGLLQQRFDFLLVVYSLFVAGALSTQSVLNLKLALTAGAILCFALSLTVFRIYVKVDMLLIMLYEFPDHPISVCKRRLQTDRKRTQLFGVNRIIGWIIPATCTLSLAVAATFSWFGCITPL